MSESIKEIARNVYQNDFKKIWMMRHPFIRIFCYDELGISDLQEIDPSIQDNSVMQEISQHGFDYIDIR